MDEFTELCLPFYQPKKQTDFGDKVKNNTKPKARSRRFIKGPIDLQWVMRASELGSREVRIGLALWYFSGLNKGDMKFRTGIGDLGLGTASPSAVRRAIRRLCEAGLVRVNYKGGSKSSYELLLPPIQGSDAPLTEPLHPLNGSCNGSVTNTNGFGGALRT